MVNIHCMGGHQLFHIIIIITHTNNITHCLGFFMCAVRTETCAIHHKAINRVTLPSGWKGDSFIHLPWSSSKVELDVAWYFLRKKSL